MEGRKGRKAPNLISPCYTACSPKFIHVGLERTVLSDLQVSYETLCRSGRQSGSLVLNTDRLALT